MPSTLPAPRRVPTTLDLTDVAISVAESFPFAGEWQRPAMRRLLDDLTEILYAAYPADDPDTYDGDGVACYDDCDGDDLIRLCCEVASDPDGWVDGYLADRADSDYSPISGEGRFLLGGE